MNEKRLQEIDRRVNAIRYVFNGWDMVPLTIAEANELTTEIRRLREALARVRAVWEDVHDETSIVGIIDNALGMEER